MSEGERRESTMTSVWWIFLYLNTHPDALFLLKRTKLILYLKGLGWLHQHLSIVPWKVMKSQSTWQCLHFGQAIQTFVMHFLQGLELFQRQLYEKWELTERSTSRYMPKKRNLDSWPLIFVKVEICFALLRSLISEIINYLMGYFEINTFNI